MNDNDDTTKIGDAAYDDIGNHEDYWAKSLPHDFDTTEDEIAYRRTADVRNEEALEQSRRAIESLEIAAEVHPLAPAIILLSGQIDKRTGKNWSCRAIAKRCGITHPAVGDIFRRAQAEIKKVLGAEE